MAPGYIVMKTSEWDRLRRKAGPAEVGPSEEDMGRVKEREALAEVSRQWVRSWPDSDEGIVIQALKKKEQEKLNQEAVVKAYHEKRKNKSNRKTIEVAEKAKQMIFEASGYGKELTSSLLESMTLEERDMHLQFNNDIKQRAKARERELELKCTNMRLEEDKRRDQEESKKKLETMKNVEINKGLSDMKHREIEKERMDETESRLENTRFTKMLLEYEAKEESKCSQLQKQAIQEHLADQKEVQLNRRNRDDIDEAIVAVWRKHNDVVRCKEEKVFHQIHKERYNTEGSKQNFELLKSLQDDEKNRYDEFIEKGIKRSEEIVKLKDAKEAKDLKAKSDKRYALAKEYKNASENCQSGFKAEAWLDRSKCVCVKQSLFTQEAPDYKKKREEEKRDIINPIIQEKDPAQLSFLAPQNRLVLALKEREKHPSPWTGTQAAHAQFMTQADGVMRQCKYKTMARRVVQNYKKNNNLDHHKHPPPTACKEPMK